jgi:methylglutaconyl-CoA hydratase
MNDANGGEAMAFETILTDISARGVATITLNRPDRGNAFNATMQREIVSCLAELAGSDDVRVLLIRAAGKHFCAGADVSGRGSDSGAASGATPATLADLLVDIDRFPKPTIALVQGGAVGGGAGIAACCDVTLADAQAFFSIPEVRIGVAPGGLVSILVRTMGERNFRRYALSGERIKAVDALRVGLVHEIVDSATCDAVLDALIDSFLLGAPGAQRDTKRAVAALETPTLEGMKEASHKPGSGHTMTTPDALEGIAAFREKRKPNWYRG